MLPSAGLLVEHSTHDAFAADGTGQMVRTAFSKQLARAIAARKARAGERFGHWLANG